MSGDRRPVDPGAEREIDLGALARRASSRAGGSPSSASSSASSIGAALLAQRRQPRATASALIAPGQAFSPNGNAVVLSYLSSPRGDQRRSPPRRPTLDAGGGEGGHARRRAARARHDLDDHDGRRLGATAAPCSFGSRCRSRSAKQAEDAANAIARSSSRTRRRRRTSRSRSRSTASRLANYAARLEDAAASGSRP